MTRREYNNSVDAYSDGLYRFMLKHCKDADDAKDIVQDVYVKLWEKVDTVDYAKVKSYLFTAAYRTMLDKFKKKKPLTGEVFEYSNPSHESSYSDVNEVLEIGLKQLPVKQKSAIMLRDFEGYSYDEIAEIMTINVSQIKVLIFRARKALKQYIGKIENLI